MLSWLCSWLIDWLIVGSSYLDIIIVYVSQCSSISFPDNSSSIQAAALEFEAGPSNNNRLPQLDILHQDV